jgi:uncharacterized MAPEG superfamily protein
MTSDLWALFATLVLAAAQLSASSILTLRQAGPDWVLSARDEARDVTGVTGRVVRAYRNLLESFPQFAASLFLVHASNTTGGLTTIGAWIFFGGRLAYVPAYVRGVPGVRPACWMAAQIGVFLIWADIFVP